ncbi:MAG: DUF1700 domain-containing protein [Lachnospiraceae bacterium]|nr:DUF1700 domain-containing protein [Lachnospiraceae bacterium]
MGGQEFLDKLRLALSGQVAASQVEESIAYYREYISTQIRMGQSEETVLRNLGDPRLIAKSIISANAGEESYTQGRFSREHVVDEEEYYAQTREQNMPKVVRLNGWLALGMTLLSMVVIVGIIFSLISLLLPVIVILGVVYFFIKVFRDWLN